MIDLHKLSEKALYRTMLAMAAAHDRKTDKCSTAGATRALRAGSGMATEYWRSIAAAAIPELLAALQPAPPSATPSVEEVEIDRRAEELFGLVYANIVIKYDPKAARRCIAKALRHTQEPGE